MNLLCLLLGAIIFGGFLLVIGGYYSHVRLRP